ncbi:HAD superfamily hydrolase (TIGR01509 family) [Algoriphagus sp. 4150]|uniref:HAD family hydrolase n=1 Tax=Algoriphagus sp. 4150 TaxID=2817756 RepID=UPI00285F80DC|nr:HAD family phosphatase [Algoriphagus sp. 4150]MDR7132160.1 HAD superfamily hydrolase (TIGR01509 family) [Algoriphagus sp. 4150]
MLKAVIFDMDGVICHTNPFHSIAFQRFFAKRNLNPTEAEYAEHMYGKNNGYILSHFLGRKIEGEELLELEFEKESLFREIYQEQVVPISGFLDFFYALKQAGLKTGVATSAPFANLELIAGKLNLFPHLESALASEQVAKHKPDPEVYLKTAANLSLDPSQCVVFEDSFSGVSAAKNAKMKVVGVLSSHTVEELPPCDLYIENYENLEVENLLSLLE